MKHLLTVAVLGFAMSVTSALAEAPKPTTSTKPAEQVCANGKDKDGKCLPAVTLPDGTAALPAGEATNFAFIAPLVGGLLGIGALAAGGSKSPNSTPSTTSN